MAGYYDVRSLFSKVYVSGLQIGLANPHPQFCSSQCAPGTENDQVSSAAQSAVVFRSEYLDRALKCGSCVRRDDCRKTALGLR
jgi:hypothetical protein